jgi:hypothetical protein
MLIDRKNISEIIANNKILLEIIIFFIAVSIIFFFKGIDISKLTISSEVFATIFVGQTVLFVEYGNIFEEMIKGGFSKTLKRSKNFGSAINISILFSLIGLIDSILNTDIYIELILFLCSITSTVLVFSSILDYKRDISMELIKMKKAKINSLKKQVKLLEKELEKECRKRKKDKVKIAVLKEKTRLLIEEVKILISKEIV